MSGRERVRRAKPWVEAQAAAAEQKSKERAGVRPQARVKLKTKQIVATEEMDDVSDLEATVPAKMGAPTKYSKALIPIAQAMCEVGATDEELAEKFGVDVWTIWNWKKKHPDFSQAVKRAKAVEDDRVESKMLDSIISGKKDFNTTAAIFWLKSRRREVYNQPDSNQPVVQQLFVNLDPEKMKHLPPQQLKMLETVLKQVGYSNAGDAMRPKFVDVRPQKIDEHDPEGDDYAETV